jgi:hypothetical protein
MKMDLSYWVNLNETIKFEPTKKQYFNRYSWRLVYAIDKVHLAVDKNIVDLISHIRAIKHNASLEKKYSNALGGYNYYSYHHRIENWQSVDAILIDRVRTVMRVFKDRVKFRTEGSKLQVYASSEQDLKEISQAISAYENMKIISSPKPGTEDALSNGVVFMNNIDYKYKVILRDGNYNTTIKQSILAQLLARDDVKLPPNLVRELRKKYPALWNAYFYSNDDSIATILTLISPGIIGKIHPIDQLQ